MGLVPRCPPCASRVCRSRVVWCLEEHLGRECCLNVLSNVLCLASGSRALLHYKARYGAWQHFLCSADRCLETSCIRKDSCLK